ncbi:hypothetical protein BGZ83_010770 [Gryganskiella cystojenkinii]|nr:hypothetical protein BGZ83_010770 [Gryganskiella cystojenkinii]
MTGTDKKTALVLIADGTEEMEAVITIDVLVRAGIEVTVASIKDNNEALKCSRGVRILPDTHLSALTLPSALSPHFYSILFIPGGGPGAQAMVASPLVHQWIQVHAAQPNVLLAAVCAGPTVLKAARVAKGAQATSHPSVSKDLVDYFVYRDDLKGEEAIVVHDKEHRLMTSRGPGSTFALALRIVKEVKGQEVMESVRGPMMFP